MVGDIVLVAEENLPRIRWAMGRVLQVLPGSDNLVRSVRLRTSRGDITRPVAKVHLLKQGLTLISPPGRMPGLLRSEDREKPGYHYRPSETTAKGPTGLAKSGGKKTLLSLTLV
ncbi:hypothetical protein M514_05259 [Trichuris suis]|uniref:DUF5641 domain-containing protein n=1 Tax=Trichuris suis TaxID=68888 RepID=A0A085MW80_9BILA|nr:hypothetical protein M514_05259 [Trichuris suis]